MSFDVGDGEIVGIIGPNGAGKTTLFDLISGYLAADAGRVVSSTGATSRNDSATVRARRGLGRCFQDARLFPDMTVTETIAVALERWTTQRSVLAAALRFPTVFDAEERTTRTGRRADRADGPRRVPQQVHPRAVDGHARIVDLACLVAHRPTVVLLDEPSSGIAQREVEALAPVLLRSATRWGQACW